MIINGNALHIPLASGSVQCVVTSPPYWGLRDYGTATWIGGDAECKHKDARHKNRFDYPLQDGIVYQATNAGSAFSKYDTVCPSCGATRVDNQLGLERIPEEYIANMVSVFREVWRVMRDDGTLWLNVGDSYAGGNQTGRNDNGRPEKGRGWAEYDITRTKIERNDGLKSKDLVGIPWRLAFALQADGWYLRSDIIWAKPNPMPESVTDRPTKSHEYLFLLTKRERYYYDAEAIREDNVRLWDETNIGINNRINTGVLEGKVLGRESNPHCGLANTLPNPAGRNRRTVWTIPTMPYKGAHFATFPEALVEPCIKAGTSERGACPKCGKGWRRVVEKSGGNPDLPRLAPSASEVPNGGKKRTTIDGTFPHFNGSNISYLGWQPSCTCDAGEPVPCLVFDPFVGSGTVVKVAYDLGRRGVGLDLSMDYLSEQAKMRSHNGHVGRLI